MDLHQLSVSYDPVADRVMVRVRARDGEQFAGWLTRRLMARLWPVLQQMAADMASVDLASRATVVPEAKVLLAEASRAEALLRSDLATPFDSRATAHPLGAEPLLLTDVELSLRPGGQLLIGFKGADGRSFQLHLHEDLVQALMHLTEKALLAADWGLQGTDPAPPPIASSRRPQLLN